MIKTVITELLQDIAMWTGLFLVLRLMGWHLDIWQWVAITAFMILTAMVHYSRGLRYGLRFVVTSFVKENIEK